MKFKTVRTALASLLAAAFCMGAAPALAQGDNIEELIVTGSYIKGSPEDAELPIDVVDSEDLEKLGSPSVAELVRHLGVTAANLAETNQFTTDGQANEGLSTVNLRGLGSARTLVLLNGRRQVSTELVGVDISAFPVSAIGRIEMLKDGAAAVYGSDAIGGVVNFITREGFDGFEIGGSFQDIEGTSGDHTLELLWGKTGDNWNFMLAAETGGRGELQVKDRDWANISGDENNPGGWSGIGHPGNIAAWIGGSLATPIVASQPVSVQQVDASGTTTTVMYNTKADETITPAAVPRAGPDPQCILLGAQRYPDGIGGRAGTCGFNYSYFDNLTEETEFNKVFGSFDVEFSDNHRMHVEGLWSEVDLPEWKTSPSYPPQSLTGPDRVVPSYHPGLAGFVDQYWGEPSTWGLDAEADADAIIDALDTSMLPDGSTIVGLTDGASLTSLVASDHTYSYPNSIVINRMTGVIGAFETGEPEEARRYTSTARLAIGFDGSIGDTTTYDVSLAWSRRERDIGGQDMHVQRMAMALRGLGGEACEAMWGEFNTMIQASAATVTVVDPMNPTMTERAAIAAAVGAETARLALTNRGKGCDFYNPFSTAINYSHVSEQFNPDYQHENRNTGELLRWLVGEERFWARTNSLAVLNAVVSGETAWELQGGTVSYAAGAQVREESYESRYNDVSNRAVNPCPFDHPLSATLGFVSADQLSPDCEGKTGLQAFLAAGTEQTEERDIYALFGELALPITADVDMQVALRYEDYGGKVGASIDPKVALNWRITDELSLRHSVSTTFRGPPQSILGGRITELSFIPATTSFKAVDRDGNPDLDPESAFSANLGAIYQFDNFYASLDYWHFIFEDSFQLESFNGILSAYGFNGYGCLNKAGDDKGANYDTPVCAQLRDQIFPVAAHTDLSNVERIEIQWINGEQITTSGLDFKVQYDFVNLLPGTLALALDGTWVIDYKTDDQLNRNGIALAEGGDLIGLLNYNRGASFTSKPQLKTNFTVSFENEAHYASLIARFVSAYDDEGMTAAEEMAYPHLMEIDEHVTLDAHYQFRGLDRFSIGLAVINATDEDPPAARGDLNYDPFTHNPFGRMVKLDMTYRIRSN